MGSESMLQEILWDTKIGWWKVDMARRVLLLSDYLCKTIGTEESEIGYDRFLQSVGEPFRASLKSLMSTDASLFSAEQIFSLCGPRGEVWFRWKVLRRETAADKGLVVSGYAQEISEREALPVDLCSIERMNTLLYRLNNISHTLLSFLHIGSIDEAINKVLTDVLKIFRGSRTYIAEFDWDNRRHIYTYEVTDKGVESGRDRFDRLSMDETPWWVEQLEKRSPIALSCLDDLPSRARNEHDILAAQNIGSLFVLPMTFRDKLWGYAGIDVIGEHRDWQNEDYQWFASLVNIINICIELQRSKREAQIERDYLQNLYRYMPLGYVRFRMIYDKTGTPVDYKVLDSNYAAEKIIGKSQADYVGRLASELEIEDMPEYLKVFAKVLQVELHVEKEVRLLASGRYVHVVMYSTTPEEVICLLSDMTEMYETHEALDRSEKLLRNIYDNIPVGIELYDRNGLLVDLNNKDLEIFGIRDKEDVLGVDFFKNPILDEEVWRRVRNREEFSFKAYYPFDRLNGYYVTSENWNFAIDKANAITGTTTVKNYQVIKTVQCVAASTNSVIKNATIGVYDSANKLITSGTTDDNGKVQFWLQAPGQYTIKQTKVDAPYTLSSEVINVKVTNTDKDTGNNLYTIRNTVPVQTGAAELDSRLVIAFVVSTALIAGGVFIVKRFELDR